MIEEQARVVAVEGDYAVVETQRKSTCGSCSLNKGCGTAVVSKVLGRAPLRLRAVNQVNAAVDERVVIGIDESDLLKGSFSVYVVPLILMLLCAGIGEMIGSRFSIENSEGTTIFAAFSGLAMGFWWVRRYSRRLRRQRLCQPQILRSVPDEFRVEFR